MFVRAFARVIRPGWRLRSMTPVAIQYLRARDRPMHMRNALVVWAPKTTTTTVVVVVVVRSAPHTALAPSRTSTACGGTQPRHLDPPHRRCNCTLGRGSAAAHFVGAGSVVASKILKKTERERELSAKYENEWIGK